MTAQPTSETNNTSGRFKDRASNDSPVFSRFQLALRRRECLGVGELSQTTWPARCIPLGFGTKQYVRLHWLASESLGSRLLKQNQGTGSIGRVPSMQEVLGSIPSTGDKTVLKQK